MREEGAIEDIQDTIIFPKSPGKKIVFLDKESMLSRLSNIRDKQKQDVVDRFFTLSRDQAYYYTDIYIMSEVFSTVRSSESAEEMAKLREDLLKSSIEVMHGSDSWAEDVMSDSPKTVFLAATDALESRSSIDCKLPEAALVLQAAKAEADYLFSYDSAVRTLSSSFKIDPLPHTEFW